MGKCSRCKQESYPRHKWGRSGVHMVLCKSCLAIANGHTERKTYWWSPFKGLLDWVRKEISRVFHPRTKQVELKSTRTFNSTAKQRASKLPMVETKFKPHHLR